MGSKSLIFKECFWAASGKNATSLGIPSYADPNLKSYPTLLCTCRYTIKFSHNT